MARARSRKPAKSSDANSWEKHVRNHEESDLSQSAYCNQHKLSASTFSKYKKKLSQSTASGITAGPDPEATPLPHIISTSDVNRAWYRWGYMRWTLSRLLSEFGGAGFDDQPDRESVVTCCNQLRQCLDQIEAPRRHRLGQQLDDYLQRIPDQLPEIEEFGRGLGTRADVARRAFANGRYIAMSWLWENGFDPASEVDRALAAHGQPGARSTVETVNWINAQRHRADHADRRAVSRRGIHSHHKWLSEFYRISSFLKEDLTQHSDNAEVWFELGHHVGALRWAVWLPDFEFDFQGASEYIVAALAQFRITLTAGVPWTNGNAWGWQAIVESLDQLNDTIEKRFRDPASQQQPILIIDLAQRVFIFRGVTVQSSISSSVVDMLQVIVSRAPHMTTPEQIRSGANVPPSSQQRYVTSIRTDLTRVLDKSDTIGQAIVKNLIRHRKKTFALGIDPSLVETRGTLPAAVSLTPSTPAGATTSAAHSD